MATLEQSAERFARGSTFGISQLLRNVGKLSEAGRELCKQAVESTAQHMRDIAASKAPVATGALKSGINARAIGDKGLTWEVSVPAKYALPMEFGYLGVDGQGNRRHKLPSPRLLAGWAALRGVNVFALSRSIRNFGYPANDFLVDAFYNNGFRLRLELIEIFKAELPRMFPDNKGAAAT